MKALIGLLGNIYKKNPQKWGIKIWYLADVKYRFVYNFDIYCGRNVDEQVEGEISVVHGVVRKLTTGLGNKGHCVVIDNFFTSILLFMELE